jgi:sterol desaturase/sphingolipid hydroxylase (fatty acid hydroxylase superfamily)
MAAPPLALLAILVLSVAAEITWSRLRRRSVYNLKESLSNLGTMVVNGVMRPAALAWTYYLMSLIEPLQPFRLPDTAWSFLVTFIVADFAFYVYHRASHAFPLLWTMHHAHHSSPWMNLTTAVRLSWLGKFASPLIFAPFVLLGLSPEFLTASLALGLVFQFFLHTEVIGRLGWFEGKLLNTPSAHRVHHGSNTQYIDKNYAGVFIVWDHLFGTYEPEGEPVRYGTTTGFIGHNPLVVHFLPLWKYLNGDWKREKQIAAEQEALELVAPGEWSAPA